MITEYRVMGMPADACSFFKEKWDGYVAGPYCDEDLLYICIGAFSRHMVELTSRGETSEFEKGEMPAKELGGIGVTGSNQSNEDLKMLVAKTAEAWNRIDVLVNSAGHGPRAPILELSDDDWHRGMEVYFLNVVRPARLVTPIMQRQKFAVIISISTLPLLNQILLFRLPVFSGLGLLSAPSFFRIYMLRRTSACTTFFPAS